MGTQTRQAPRVEPATARRGRYDIHGNRRAAARPAARRSLCHHARQRHPATSGNRPKARRQDGAPSQPPAVRRRHWTCRRGICGAAAARHTLSTDRPRRLAVPAHLLQHERHRSLRRGRVRRVPGSLRRRLLCRQGHLRRGCVRSRAGRPRAGEHASQSRSFRGNIRPRWPGFRYRGRRGVSVAL